MTGGRKRSGVSRSTSRNDALSTNPGLAIAPTTQIDAHTASAAKVPTSAGRHCERTPKRDRVTINTASTTSHGRTTSATLNASRKESTHPTSCTRITARLTRVLTTAKIQARQRPRRSPSATTSEATSGAMLSRSGPRPLCWLICSASWQVAEFASTQRRRTSWAATAGSHISWLTSANGPWAAGLKATSTGPNDTAAKSTATSMRDSRTEARRRSISAPITRCPATQPIRTALKATTALREPS